MLNFLNKIKMLKFQILQTRGATNQTSGYLNKKD